MEHLDTEDYSSEDTGRAIDAEKNARSDLETMFAQADRQAASSEYGRSIGFHRLAVNLGLSLAQVEGLKNFEGRVPENISWGRYSKDFSMQAKELGLSDKQIKRLLEYDKKNNWG